MQLRDGDLLYKDLLSMASNGASDGIKTSEQLIREGYDPGWFTDREYWAK